jgi:predicted glycogen debranching enzyme
LAWAREWIVTNGLGGYASGTISGTPTRRYHGLLIAALPAPLGRYVMFNHLAEEVRTLSGTSVRLDDDSFEGETIPHPPPSLLRFTLENGLPVWNYEAEGIEIEKRVLLPHRQNTVLVQYRVLQASERLRLRLTPSFHFRPHEAAVNCDPPPAYAVSVSNEQIEIRSGVAPPLHLRVLSPHCNLVLGPGSTRPLRYHEELCRGYDSTGALWSPGYFRADLAPGETITVIASTESWDTLQACDPPAAWDAELQRRESLLAQAAPQVQSGLARELVLAADQFIIRPTTRVADAAFAEARGDDVRTVIAGYHWFTDWGRDTMISFEGLTLVTGRHQEAAYLLRTFARYVRDGLIPNLFPEGQREGLYHTADASLWYFHAVARYVAATGDLRILRQLLPVLHDMADRYAQGTQFGIHVDPDDGLLTQGAPGYALTWMDAKVDGWVVTPRRGKTVELNALWYNALRLLAAWSQLAGDQRAADDLVKKAERTRDSFHRRFWNAQESYLYDLVDGEQGDDPAQRPNQILAISLDHPILDPQHWPTVLETVRTRLVTPVGLRSLAPGHRDYKPKYDGDLRSRDAAYHQGTVWTWLIGPFIDAWLRVHPEDVSGARKLLSGFDAHLSDAGVGSISEIFDAEAPYQPRGCVAQAWSVAEVLRCWAKTAQE